MLNRLTSLILRGEVAIPAERRANAGLLVLALFELALFAVTRPLWFGRNEFPQVPLVSFPRTSFLSTDTVSVIFVISICVLIARLISKASLQHVNRRFSGVILLTGLALVLADQHRLQAWHWLFLLNLAAAVILQGADRLLVMRQLVAAVYVCSALSRITLVPAEGITGVIVRQLLSMLGIAAGETRDPAFDFLCHAMTAGELLVGLLLLNAGTRKFGCLSAVVLHVTLLIVLGPWGLNHHAGVLLWNACFLCLLPVLFIGKDSGSIGNEPEQIGRRRVALSWARIMIWAFPVSGLLGIADNWPSWQLYSSRPESWVLYVHAADRDRVAPTLTDYVGKPAPLSDWCPVLLDRWSLERTSSPMYPEDRYQLAVIAWVLEQSDQPLRFQVAISEPRRLRWWRRTERTIETDEQLQRERQRFLISTTAAGLSSVTQGK
jgi:hypothetical protein